MRREEGEKGLLSPSLSLCLFPFAPRSFLTLTLTLTPLLSLSPPYLYLSALLTPTSHPVSPSLPLPL
jgi:hypothetical protein